MLSYGNGHLKYIDQMQYYLQLYINTYKSESPSPPF